MFAMLVPASSAAAAPHHPTGEFAQFGDCPLSRPALNACLYAVTNSGSLTIGKKTTPIVHPVVLQGGIEWEPDIFGKLEVFGAEDGNTLVKTPQPVPGGLAGIPAPASWPAFLRNLYEEIINSNGLSGINATMELAAPASSIGLNPANQLLGKGTALKLPVKIKLDNAFLGSNCYIGSNAHPIVLELTTGTTSPPLPNTPISGSPGNGTENASGTLATFNETKLVDNAFAVPGANGCGGLFSLLVDPFVNSVVGVPAP
ncbi:MAG: hypothetical protein ACTHK3_05000, partial [Solirubrobacterales bacterium]